MDTEKKKVLILYTGGTMGMKISARDGSLAPMSGYLTESIIAMPEMSNPEMPLFDIKEYDTLIDSSCMGPSNWVDIANDIEANYLMYDGFVVIMGTDTMAYASSALSFMLENLAKTVVFTGSQIPFCEVYNDARRNLIVSLIFASNGDFPEVCVCFNDKILRANRTTKINSIGLNAFDSPNFPPLATLGAFIHENIELSLPPPKGRFRVHKTLEAGVVVLKLVPGFDDEAIMALIDHSTTLRGIIMEMYGTGNGPSKKNALLSAISKAHAKGIIVVAISQCLQGGVSLETYSLGKDFKNSGVISGGDMTTESCSTKLAYLIGRFQDQAVVEKLITENIRGEMNSFDMHKKYFNSRLGSSLKDVIRTNVLSKL